MKKLFTLTLALLIAFAGYSQVKSKSTKDGLRKVATQQKVGRMDNVNANAESQPNLVRIDYGSGELDYTTYDWQTNAGPINRTIVWPDNKVNFAYTMATATNFSDRWYRHWHLRLQQRRMDSVRRPSRNREDRLRFHLPLQGERHRHRCPH